MSRVNVLDALQRAELHLETLHSIVLPSKGEGAKIVYRDLKLVRAAIHQIESAA